MNELEIKLKKLCNSGKCGLCCFFPIPNERNYEGIPTVKYYPKNFVKANKMIKEDIECLNFDIILHFKDHDVEFIYYGCKYLSVVTDEEKNEIKTMLCSIYPKKGEKDKRSIVCGADAYPVWVKKSSTCYPCLDEINIWVNDKKYSINNELKSIERQRRKEC
jgi:hypothetical protein